MTWHQRDHMQTICTLLQTDNHTNTSSLNFYTQFFLILKQQCHVKHCCIIYYQFIIIMLLTQRKRKKASMFCITFSWQRKQVAAVLTAIGHIAAATYRITLTHAGYSLYLDIHPKLSHPCGHLGCHIQFRQHLKTHLFKAEKLQRTVTLNYCALYRYSYLLTYIIHGFDCSHQIVNTSDGSIGSSIFAGFTVVTNEHTHTHTHTETTLRL